MAPTLLALPAGLAELLLENMPPWLTLPERVDVEFGLVLSPLKLWRVEEVALEVELAAVCVTLKEPDVEAEGVTVELIEAEVVPVKLNGADCASMPLFGATRLI